MTITQNTCIENIKNPKTIPIIFESRIIGQCVINTDDDDGIICDGIIYEDNIVNDKLQIGMFYRNEEHTENDLTIMDNICITNIVK